VTDDPVVLAVDFGTTNTLGVARWGHRRPSRVTVDGVPSMPSAVLFGHDGSLIVGRDAIRLGRAAPARLEPRPKSRLDEDVVLLGDRTVPVLDLVRAVLTRLCDEVRRTAGAPVDHLVLTYPADWGTVRLGRFARVLDGLAARTSLVPEPVAAAAAAGRTPGGTYAVLDFGGGTCDAAVVRAGQSHSVLACAGLPDLGGDDLDQRIVEFVLGRSPTVAARLADTVSTQDVRVLRDRLLLREDARAAKELLSRHDVARVAVPGLDEPVVVRRADFDRIVATDLERAATLLSEVLRDAAAPVDEVLLVGGSSRIPALGELLRRRLDVPVALAREPESAVAFGALAVTDSTEHTPAHPVVLAARPAPAAAPGPDPMPAAPARPGRGRRLPVALAGLAVLLIAVVVAVWSMPWGTDVAGSPGESSRPAGPREPADATPVTGPPAPPPRVVPSGRSGRFHTQQLELEVRADRVATTGTPAPAGYRWVRADVTVTLRDGYHDLTEATPMRLVDDRGQRILPARTGPAVQASRCLAPLRTIAVGGSRKECQLFLVPDATPIAGVMYDDFSGTEVNRGGFVAGAELPAAGPTELPGVVGDVGDAARAVDLDRGRFAIAVDEVVEAPSAYLTEDSRPMNGGRYVVARVTVAPRGGTDFRAEDFTFLRLLDDRGLPVPEERLTPAELVDCPPADRVPPGENATACLVFTIGARTPVAGVAYVGATDHDVASWRTWRLS
jgi:actin-like ATPase involved in cell morphogenesis